MKKIAKVVLLIVSIVISFELKDVFAEPLPRLLPHQIPKDEPGDRPFEEGEERLDFLKQDEKQYGPEEDPLSPLGEPSLPRLREGADESTGEGDSKKTFDEASKEIDDLTKDAKTPEGEKDTQGTSTKTPPSIPDSFSVGTYLKLGDQKSRVGGAGIVKIIVDAIDLLVKLTGSLALIVFIVGALLTVVSEGQQDKLEKGKTAMLYAVYGIIISLMAFVIVTFVQSILF